MGHHKTSPLNLGAWGDDDEDDDDGDDDDDDDDDDDVCVWGSVWVCVGVCGFVWACGSVHTA